MKYFMDFVTIILILCSCFVGDFVEGLACTAGQTVGDDPVPTTPFDAVGAPGTPGRLYLLGNNYKINCCGVITGWKFYAVSDSALAALHVYRYNIGTGTYDLVGEKTYTVSPIERDTVVSITLLAHEQFTVLPDDLLGWYEEADILGIVSGSIPEGKMIDNSARSASPDFDSVLTTPNGRPALQAILKANSAPQFDNLPFTQSFKDTEAVVDYTCGQTAVSDADDDVSQLTITMDTLSTEFKFDGSKVPGEIKVKTIPSSGTYPLQFSVQDPCGNKVIKIATCVVINQPPTIDNLPDSIQLAINDPGNKKLKDLTVTEPTGQTYTCSLDSTTPATAAFSCVASGGAYSIWVNAAPSFAASSYDLSITCKDSEGNVSAAGVYTVRITPNSPPVWDDTVFPDGKTVTISADSTITGFPVFKVAATDVDSTDLKFNMTAVANAPFQMTDSGDLKATRSIKLEKVPAYDIDVYVNDGSNVVGPRTLTVLISDINEIPAFSTKSASVQVPEDTNGGFTIYTVAATDGNGDALEYSLSSDPASGDSYFEIDSKTGEIKLKTGADINYETLVDNNFKLSVTATDQKETSESFVLTVDITNVNEKPVLDKSTYTIQVPEGTKMGDTAFLGSIFTVTDPDFGDKLKYSLSSGCMSNYLNMDETTGNTFYTGHYNVDDPTKQDTTPSRCRVTVEDAAGLKDTAWVSMTVTDVNDVTPDFDQTVYTFTTADTTTAGTIVGTVTATDLDLTSPNNEITYTASSGCGVRNDGRVYPTINLSTYNKKTLPCVVTATDNGNPRLSSTALVNIILTTPTPNNNNPAPGGGSSPTTTQSSVSHSIFTGANIAWWVLLGLALLGLLTAALCVAIRYCHRCHCGKICKKNPRIQNIPKTKPQSPPKEPEKPRTPPRSPVVTPPSPARPKTPPEGSMWDFWSSSNYMRQDIAYK